MLKFAGLAAKFVVYCRPADGVYEFSGQPWEGYEQTIRASRPADAESDLALCLDAAVLYQEEIQVGLKDRTGPRLRER